MVPLAIACAIALFSALGLVLARRIVHCACLLLVHSLAIAACYLLLAADFAAMGQVIVYSGAIVVLFLFVVLLLPQDGVEPKARPGRLAIALAGGGVVGAVLLSGATAVAAASAPAAPATVDFEIKGIARSLFGPQLVPFELTAILLLVAIVGGVTLWQRHTTTRSDAEGRR
ncbi:MAG: NADH-quinone oxidoreductase subunit J [Planctomycetes bacterium]|nr:NADH-quinone oxidoreductase subunit J [Planctomycetota bacterium]